MSRSLLAERLRRLQRVGIVERLAPKRGKWSEYRLTSAGRELQQVIDVLGVWGARWAFGDPRPDELDPIVLLWWMRRRVDFERIPRRRVVLQFEFRGAIERTYWLIIEPSDASVCLKNPGFEIDLIVSADIWAFYRVWLGRSTLAEALRREQVQRPAHCIWKTGENHPGREAAIRYDLCLLILHAVSTDSDLKI